MISSESLLEDYVNNVQGPRAREFGGVVVVVKLERSVPGTLRNGIICAHMINAKKFDDNLGR